MTVKLAKRKPEWLRKISSENEKIANLQLQGRIEFVLKKLEFESTIDTINDKYGTSFSVEDIFSITQEEEQQTIDFSEGEDDDD